MPNIIQEIENAYLEKAKEALSVPPFKAGDTVRVLVKFARGTTTKLQTCEGVVIARKNKGIRSSFSIRKVYGATAVEYVFPLYSPNIEKITVVRVGCVRRAKLYYLRNLRGKAARIKAAFSRKAPASAPPSPGS